MGQRGPAPEPTHLKLLKGNPGKRPLNDREPKPQGALPECPIDLSDDAKEAWTQWATDLAACGLATSLDATALRLLCEAYARYLEAAGNVAKHGAVWMEKGEGAIPKFAYSPYWAVMNNEYQKVKGMLKEFGMTPSARTGLQVAPQQKQGVRRRAQ